MKENLPKTIAICAIWLAAGVVAVMLKDVQALAYAVFGTVIVIFIF